MSRRAVTLLGSTGSVGTQAVDVVLNNPGRFVVTGLAAGGSDLVTLARQAAVLGVGSVAVADVHAVGALRDALEHQTVTYPGWSAKDVEVLAGADAAAELAARPADVVLNGITGAVGLAPTLAALGAGTTVALANKESLVVGGSLVKAAKLGSGQIVPVDSEHSAIAQCLQAGTRGEVRRLILTASGGPFRGWSRERLVDVTPAQALAHPTWQMGPWVTVSSATMMNKALELIEAHLLFEVPTEQIAVVVHPQSVVHSMVEFVDGATIAQASPPDMHLPIALGLGWPDRVDGAAPTCDWSVPVAWTFEPLDEEVFGAVRLARAAVAASATHPAVLNAANEVCVEAFLAGRIGFLDIVATVERVLGEHDGVVAGVVLDDVLDADAWARARAEELLVRV
ncbi:MAG: 1-deoxy-D-xylulose-5-phosphate reductoisomerase [Micrococcales bacterium]|nr:1-deoxy-D-xylulose-5-phosphate reductoisomerase [Micrococcales bacterium]